MWFSWYADGQGLTERPFAKCTTRAFEDVQGRTKSFVQFSGSQKNCLQLLPRAREREPVVKVGKQFRRWIRRFALFVPCGRSEVAKNASQRAALRDALYVNAFQPDIRWFGIHKQKPGEPPIVAQSMGAGIKPQML